MSANELIVVGGFVTVVLVAVIFFALIPDGPDDDDDLEDSEHSRRGDVHTIIVCVLALIGALLFVIGGMRLGWWPR